MEIRCTDISKKFKKDILFKNFSYTFTSSKQYAILGPNSSGKSTMLRILAGVLESNKGEISWVINGNVIPRESTYEYISFAAPAMELLQDYSVQDILDFHFSLKYPKTSINELLDLSDLSDFKTKIYSELSSGLKNKLKLSLALFTKSEILLLDEPCTNFDPNNIKWYQSMIEKLCENQLIIVASNQASEYEFCSEHIYLNDYKL